MVPFILTNDLDLQAYDHYKVIFGAIFLLLLDKTWPNCNRRQLRARE